MSEAPKTIGRYRVVRPLGAGAMGVVYLAEDPLLKRPVAVKLVRAIGFDAEQARARFRREAEISARLNHPNVITVYDVGEEPEHGPFLAMEFVEGRNLAELCAEGRTDVAGRLRILVHAALALDAAHGAAIVHRDVKPANLMVGRDGRVKLMDFGIARGSDATSTSVDVMLGTPSYLAPEQLRGVEPSATTDRYAFAVTAFEVLTGARPFPAETASVVLYSIVNSPPTMPPDMAPALRTVFDRALAKDPGARFPDLSSFLAALIDACELDPGARDRLRSLFDDRHGAGPPAPATGAATEVRPWPPAAPASAAASPAAASSATVVTPRPAAGSSADAPPAVATGAKLESGLGLGGVAGLLAGLLALVAVPAVLWVGFGGSGGAPAEPVATTAAEDAPASPLAEAPEPPAPAEPTAALALAPPDADPAERLPTAAVAEVARLEPTAAPAEVARLEPAAEPGPQPTAAPEIGAFALRSTDDAERPAEPDTESAPPPVAEPPRVERAEPSPEPAPERVALRRESAAELRTGLESRVRSRLRRAGLEHVRVRVDSRGRLVLANLADRGEEREARAVVAEMGESIQGIVTSLRDRPAAPKPPREQPPAWGEIRREGAEQSE